MTSGPRGVSTVLGYVLALGITAILVGGLMIGGGQYVEDQRDRVVRSELNVVAERIATDIESADRIAATGGTNAVRVESRLPSNVGGVPYQVTIRDETIISDHPNHYVIEVATAREGISISVTTTIGVEEELLPTTVNGGDVTIVLTSDDLEVRDD